MTPVTSMRGKRLALFGLGGSGLATAKALAAGGATPVCWDDAQARRDEAQREGLIVEDLKRADWRNFAALVLSPGVPLTHPQPHWTVELAKEAGVEVIGDIELFCRERAAIAPASPFIAITGTNGKSTTTALIAHILHEAGGDVQMGGNIGTPILTLEPPAPSRIHVIECSSFQIDLAPSLAPTIGVLLNITPDHLDRHGTMENYAAIKERLVVRADWSLIGVDDELSRAIHERQAKREAQPDAGGRRPLHYYPVSVERILDLGISLEGLRVVARPTPGEARILGDLTAIPTLRGKHNAQNACFAAGVADIADVRQWGAPGDIIATALRSFAGLPHRMEEVGRAGKAIFINDSKATNADSTEKALSSFESGIFWILGGKAKEGGIDSLQPLFKHVEKVYLIGASTEAFAATLEAAGLAHERCGTLDVALQRAAADAAASSADEAVVLLSPACASYDQFKNFEERGDRFRSLVQVLISQAQAQESISTHSPAAAGGRAG